MSSRLSPLTLMLALLAPMAVAQDASPGAGPNEAMLVDRNFGGFVESHPDLANYRRGLNAYRDGKLEAAYRYFRTASRFADKPSQALVAEMYWYGMGVGQDRPLAYAWMDLAAERGYARLLLLREKYWAAMSETERAEAIRRGESLYEEFGDQVAKRRLSTALRREKSRVVGSRTGYTGNSQVLALMPGTANSAASSERDETPATLPPIASMAGASFFDPTYWDPEKYFSWREQQWDREFQNGTAEVGPLEQIRSGKAAE